MLICSLESSVRCVQVRLDVSHTGEATAAFAEDNMQARLPCCTL